MTLEDKLKNGLIHPENDIEVLYLKILGQFDNKWAEDVLIILENIMNLDLNNAYSLLQDILYGYGEMRYDNKNFIPITYSIIGFHINFMNYMKKYEEDPSMIFSYAIRMLKLAKIRHSLESEIFSLMLIHFISESLEGVKNHWCLKLFETYKEIILKMKDRGSLIDTFYCVGKIYLEKKAYDNAEVLFLFCKAELEGLKKDNSVFYAIILFELSTINEDSFIDEEYITASYYILDDNYVNQMLTIPQIELYSLVMLKKGCIHFMRNEWEDAERWLKMSEECFEKHSIICCNYADCLYNLINIYNMKGDLSKALVYNEKIMFVISNEKAKRITDEKIAMLKLPIASLHYIKKDYTQTANLLVEAKNILELNKHDWPYNLCLYLMYTYSKWCNFNELKIRSEILEQIKYLQNNNFKNNETSFLYTCLLNKMIFKSGILDIELIELCISNITVFSYDGGSLLKKYLLLLEKYYLIYKNIEERKLQDIEELISDFIALIDSFAITDFVEFQVGLLYQILSISLPLHIKRLSKLILTKYMYKINDICNYAMLFIDFYNLDNITSLVNMFIAFYFTYNYEIEYNDFNSMYDVVLKCKRITLEILSYQRLLFRSKPEYKQLNEELLNIESQISDLEVIATLHGNIIDKEKINALNNLKYEKMKKQKELIALIGDTFENKSSLADVVSKMLPNSVMLEYVVYNSMIKYNVTHSNYDDIEEKVILFIIKKDRTGNVKCKVIPLVGNDEIFHNAHMLKFIFEDQVFDDEKIIIDDVRIKLYNLLIRPAMNYITRGDVLFIAPDSYLSYIPFELLGYDKEYYLINDFDIQYVECGRNLSSPFVLRRSEKSLVIGAPDIDPHKRNKNRRPFSDAKDEIKFISKKLKSSSYRGRAATKYVIGENMDTNIIYVSTHGFYEDVDLHVNPFNKSGLVFAGYDEYNYSMVLHDKYGNGLLTSNEIIGMNFTNPELAILSVCNGGTGELNYSNTCIVGMRQAFQIAGFHHCISALWEVKEGHTTNFMMRLFYHLNNGFNLTRSLSKVKREIIEIQYGDQNYTEREWAAFVYYM